MNYSNFNPMRTLVAAAVAGTLIAGCASTPKQPPGSADVRAKLTRLQSETNLASRAPLALKDAEAASGRDASSVASGTARLSNPNPEKTSCPPDRNTLAPNRTPALSSKSRGRF